MPVFVCVQEKVGKAAFHFCSFPVWLLYSHGRLRQVLVWRGGTQVAPREEIEGEGDDSRLETEPPPPKDGHVLMPGTCAMSLSTASRALQWW